MNKLNRSHWLAAITGCAALCLLVLAPAARASDDSDRSRPDIDQAQHQVDQAQHQVDQALQQADAALHSKFGRLHIHVDHHGDDNAVVSVGGDSNLAAGQQADAVVSIFGSSTSAGDVSDAVISIAGDTRVTGPVGDAAVAVLGDTYVNSKVDGDVVAVFGHVELGPQAEVGGDVVSVGAAPVRDPAAQIHGTVNSVSLGSHLSNFAWLRPWISHCMLYGRLLAFDRGVIWAWAIAGVLLVLSVLTVLICPRATERCLRTLQTYPGQSLLTGFLSYFAAPLITLVLCFTIIGIPVVPLLSIALLIAKAFGKIIVLAWIGAGVLRLLSGNTASERAPSPALMVIVGGLLVLLLYTVPFLAFVIFNLIGMLGIGVVIYTLILAARGRSQAAAAARQADILDSGTPGPTYHPPAAAAEAVSAAASAPPPGSEPPDATPGAATGAAPGSATPGTASAESLADVPPYANRNGSAATLPLAGFWSRIGAILIDAILVGAVLGLLGGHPHHAYLLFLAAYGAIMWKLRGTTVGGIVFHHQIVRLDGRALDWPTVIVRALSCFLSLFAVGLGFIWIALDPQHQAWHDKIAGTVVVRLPQGRTLV